MTPLRILGHLWAFPLTLVGLLVALLGWTRFLRLEGGAFLFVAKPGGLVDFLFRFTGTQGGAGVLTGACIFVAPAYAEDSVLVRHERRHVSQAFLFGPLLPLLYGLASLAAVVRGLHPYRNNLFELDAYAAEAA